MSMSEDLSAEIQKIVKEAHETGNWETYWKYGKNMHTLAKASAFGLMEMVGRAGMLQGSAEDKAGFLLQVQGEWGLEEKTSRRYLMVWERYEMQDFKALTPPTMAGIRSRPVQWQVRLAQGTQEFEFTQAMADAILGMTLDQLNLWIAQQQGRTIKPKPRYVRNGLKVEAWLGEHVFDAFTLPDDLDSMGQIGEDLKKRLNL